MSINPASVYCTQHPANALNKEWFRFHDSNIIKSNLLSHDLYNGGLEAVFIRLGF